MQKAVYLPSLDDATGGSGVLVEIFLSRRSSPYPQGELLDVGRRYQRTSSLKWECIVFWVFTRFLKNYGLLFVRDFGFAPGLLSIGKQLLDFLFKDVRLLGTFDIDKTLPVDTPPPPRSDGIMLKPNILFDRFVIVVFKGQKDDPAALCQRNRGRFSLGALEQNGVMFFGQSDLDCLAWRYFRRGWAKRALSLQSSFQSIPIRSRGTSLQSISALVDLIDA